MTTTPRNTDSRCPISASLEVVGEKWTLLILRDVYRGLHRFSQLERSLGCPKALLAQRLRKLVDAGILAKESYREEGQRARAAYALTAKGRDLAPILLTLQEWGLKHVDGTRVPR
ncbi:helix-turn-helix transcriptional regulator [Corynebacterium mastitidis]|uniref:Transcriptional regulator n=1 Tax=Corynebacterium mastitidis TaxID=161890 RepID=A0A2N0X645_9CORY|nr:helix-turn-helix domain-containing protein [Corynebacterium mastitidis]MCH6196435.1 helix-turn-helix transcriptional regulator [Corynebacterium mastitidis]PKF68183.1 transcriptional regulator [Corynebacterium mastitidis]